MMLAPAIAWDAPCAADAQRFAPEALDLLVALKRAQKHSVLLTDLRPTQMAVGMRAVAHKQRKIRRRVHHTRRLQRMIDAHVVPAVIGPGDAYYIVDHHHWSLALLRAGGKRVSVAVIDDFSWLPDAAFWQRMSSRGWVHAFDIDGQAVDPRLLPTSLHDLGADPFRDLAWSVRRAGGFAKCPAPYLEFRWACFFRRHITVADLNDNFRTAHAKAMALACTTEARGLPGAQQSRAA
jgi:hypothetical protein